MKKLSVLLICVLFVITNILPVSAYSYPKSFWDVNAKYEAAVKSGNHSDAIKYGNQLISLMSGAAEGPEKLDVFVTRYNQIARSYAALGDYANSAKNFQQVYNYAAQNEGKYYDYMRGAKEHINQYTPVITMYTDNGTSAYYGAVNEKKNGVLFGICSDGATRQKLDNESMVLTYQEIGQPLLSYNESVVRNASSSGCAVEFALNCPNRSQDIKNIKNMNSYLKEISDMFKKYSDVPVYLRFAAEFNEWNPVVDPQEFKTAFQYVSDYFKSRNSNVAMVWSPNQVSSWKVKLDDYYPGDRYVDWVGMSLYSQKYFLADKNQSAENNLLFRAGVNSDPVVAVKEIVEKYGNRKPIMISESGVGHKLVKSGENTSEFALQRLREQYSYLPMVYPQIKLIAYFDRYIESDVEKNDFRLSTNSTLQNEYLNLVKGARFIQDSYDNNTDFCYRPVQNGIGVESVFQVACYAHKYNSNTKSVTYFIDDKYVGMSNELPFSTFIDASAYSGQHTLKAIATFDNGQTMTTQSTVHINNPGDEITVEVSGKKVNFDQQPVLYNDRTMVPLRKIFEALGATVSWNDSTQTATGTKGDRTVKVTVGQNKMYVNSKEIKLDAAPIMVSDRTLVPARAVAEGLGCEVEWDGRYSLVSITPKVFKWSEWATRLPSDVDEDMYYIEEMTEYRYREKEYYESDYLGYNYSNFVKENVSYGSWSNWQDGYIGETDRVQVETRTSSTPKQYHYAHYCTGNISDKNSRYRTSNHYWHDECNYHDLGWFDQPLPYSDDSTSDYAYYVNGEKYRCSNSCFRWYLIETSGGQYTQYRYRDIYRTYTYWEWGDWSEYSSRDPYDYYDWDEIDVEERTLYRYKEK